MDEIDEAKIDEAKIDDLIKYGGFSVVIYHDIYSKYLDESKDYLLKITYKNKFNSDETTLLNELEFQENYSKYFPRVKNEIIILKEHMTFYNFLEFNNILAPYNNKELDIYGYFLENCPASTEPRLNPTIKTGLPLRSLIFFTRAKIRFIRSSLTRIS